MLGIKAEVKPLRDSSAKILGARFSLAAVKANSCQRPTLLVAVILRQAIDLKDETAGAKVRRGLAVRHRTELAPSFGLAG